MEACENNNSWGRRENAALIYAVLLGMAFDLLFYRGGFGISVIPFVCLFYLFYFRATGVAWKPGRRFSTVLLAAIIVLTLDFAVYAGMTFRILNLLALPLLIVSHTVLAAAEARGDNGQKHFAARLTMQLFPQSFGRIGLLLFKLHNVVHKSGSKSKTALRQIIVGLVIAIPLLIVVGALLGSADTVFERMLGRIPEWLEELKFGEWLFRIIAIAIVAIYSFGYVTGLAQPRVYVEKDRKTLGERPFVFLDMISVNTVLLLVNIVFVLFAAIQFSYLFGAGAGELPAGLTYAEYTHKGFAELNVVSLINLTLLVYSLCVYDASRPAGANLLRILQTLLTANSAIMLISAYVRLALYEEAYGFTVLRLLVHAFMIFLFMLFVLSFIRIWRKKFPLYKMWIATGVLAYALVSSSNIEGLAATLNVERYERTGKLDQGYLSRLSTDAAPAVMRLAKLEPQTGSAQALIDQFREKTMRDSKWQELTVSELLARRMLRDSAD